MSDIAFHLNTGLSQAFVKMFQNIEEDLNTNVKIQAYLAGGMAIHFYTGYRATGDIDIEFSHRLSLPDDFIIEAELENGDIRPLYIDKNYNSTFALMHPDYQEDSIEVPFDFKNFDIRVLNPADLIVSKIARFAGNDKEDIQQILMLGLTTTEQIEQRAKEALEYFVGNTSYLKHNIEEVLDMSKRCSVKRFSL